MCNMQYCATVSHSLYVETARRGESPAHRTAFCIVSFIFIHMILKLSLSLFRRHAQCDPGGVLKIRSSDGTRHTYVNWLPIVSHVGGSSTAADCARSRSLSCASSMRFGAGGNELPLAPLRIDGPSLDVCKKGVLYDQ